MFLKLLVILGVFVNLSLPGLAEARTRASKVRNGCDVSIMRGRGGGDALPWGQELTLQWKGIEGLWTAEGAENTVLNISVVKTYSDGSRQIYIGMVNGKTGELVASSTTYAVKTAKIIRTTLYGDETAMKVRIASYELTGDDCTSKVILVASIYEAEGPNNLDNVKRNTFQLRRLK
jgi:hypothetical protein